MKFPIRKPLVADEVYDDTTLRTCVATKGH
jgi:hypothetical protein